MRTSENSNFDQALLVLRRRWRLVLLCVILVGAGAVAFSLLQRKEYTASASLLFRNPQFDQTIFGGSFFAPNNDPTREAATNIDLVSLPTVAVRTAAALHLSSAVVKSAVTISGVGQANVAQVNATDEDPVQAARIANTYAQQYVLFRQGADRSKIAAAEQLVKQQLGSLPPAQRYGSVGQSLQNRANQLAILGALQTGNAELVQPASVPGSPSSPRTKRNGGLGLLLGLLLGIGLAFVAERLDRRVRDATELEDTYKVPLLGTVPESPVYEFAGAEALPGVEAEAFSLLRARLRYFNVDRDVRSLLITSAIPGEGKTTVALNLALAEAAAGNSRVVLVEADLRRPTLARRLRIPSAPGLAEILSRNTTLEAALQEVPVPGRDNGNAPHASFNVITAGALPPNPAELVESRSMIDLLSALSERFDLVIVDTPPTSVVSDAMPLMRLVSGAVIVSRINTTTRDAARHLHEQLIKLKAPTLGVVANAMPSRAGGYYGYQYYRAGYLPDEAQALRAPTPSPPLAESATLEAE